MKSSSKNARADGNVCWNQNLLPHAALEAATGTTRRHSSLRWPRAYGGEAGRRAQGGDYSVYHSPGKVADAMSATSDSPDPKQRPITSIRGD